MSKLTTAFILGVFAIVSGALNYATYPILIHHLSIADYAEFSVYTSLLAILSIPMAGFTYYMLVSFRRSFSEIQLSQRSYLNKIGWYTLYYMISVIILSTIVFFALNLTSQGALWLVIVALVPSLFVAFFAGLLQAIELFLFLGLLGVVASLLRFLLSFGVLLDASVWMAIVPFVLPGIILAFVYIWKGKKELNRTHAHLTHGTNSTNITQSVWSYVIISGSIILLQNIDVLMVKKLFSDYDVTLYASVAVIAKFALIIITILETIFSPTLVDIHKKKEHKRQMQILIGISGIGYVIACTFLPWAGNLALYILKEGELVGSWLLWSALGISMISLGFFSIFSKVYMSWGGKILTSIGIISSFLVLGFFAPTLDVFASLFAIIHVCLYGITLYYIWYRECANSMGSFGE